MPKRYYVDAAKNNVCDNEYQRSSPHHIQYEQIESREEADTICDVLNEADDPDGMDWEAVSAVIDRKAKQLRWLLNRRD